MTAVDKFYDNNLARLSPKAPAHGEPQRDAINAIVDQSVQGTCQRIKALRVKLDEIEQQTINRAADAKAVLRENVEIGAQLDAEIERIGSVIEAMARRGADD